MKMNIEKIDDVRRKVKDECYKAWLKSDFLRVMAIATSCSGFFSEDKVDFSDTEKNYIWVGLNLRTEYVKSRGFKTCLIKFIDDYPEYDMHEYIGPQYFFTSSDQDQQIEIDYDEGRTDIFPISICIRDDDKIRFITSMNPKNSYNRSRYLGLIKVTIENILKDIYGADKFTGSSLDGDLTYHF